MGHLGGRHGQPRAAQVYAMELRAQKGWSQDLPFPSPHLRAGRGGEGRLWEIPVYLWCYEGKWFLSFVSESIAVVFGQVLCGCSLGFCYSIIDVLSDVLQYYTKLLQ